MTAVVEQAEAASRSLTSSLANPTRQPEQQPIILLVEDDDTDQRLVMRAHCQWAPNTTLLVARSGDDAIEFIADRDILSSLSFVILDLKLRGKSGFDVLEFIRSRPEDVTLPVVIFSSSAEPSDVVRAYELGVSAYVSKPVDFEDHQACVREMFDFWLAINLR